MALLNGRRYLGFEIHREYHDLAMMRLEKTAASLLASFACMSVLFKWPLQLKHSFAISIIKRLRFRRGLVSGQLYSHSNV